MLLRTPKGACVVVQTASLPSGLQKAVALWGSM